MPRTAPIQTNFTAGELSPRLRARVNWEKYPNGVAELENFIIQPHGPVVKRPGSTFVNEVKTSAKKTRLIPFEFSVTQAYVLEFGDKYVRFYTAGGIVVSGSPEVPVEVTTPYAEDDLADIKFVQSADVLYLVHPSYFPRTLSRTSHTSWSIALATITGGPFLPWNTTATTLTPSALFGTGITITASADVFLEDHIGSIFRIKHETGRSVSMATQGNPCLISDSAHGLATGDIIYLLNMQPGIWGSMSGLEFSVTVADADHFWVPYDTSQFTGYLAESGRWIKKNGGIVEITAVADAKHATANVLSAFSAIAASADWSEGAWSEIRGYPSVIAFHDERLLFAATPHQPQTIWGSVVGDYSNMTSGVNDDDAFVYTLATAQLNAIQWMLDLEVLLLGTAGGCFRFSASQLEEPITPTNFQIKPNVMFGSANLQAIATGEVVLYIDRQRRKVRELAFSFEKGNTGGYVSQDMTLLSEHITKPGIAAMDLSSNPDTVVWCVRDDGVLAALTYERPQSVVGWHRHTTDGDIESVVVIPGSTASELWLLVKRTIGGAVKRYIEKIDLDDTPDDLEDCFFVDCGLTYSGVPADVISGLDHLEGETVKVLADGVVHADCVVSGGAITLDAEYSVVHAGLGYACRLTTLPIEAGAAEGTAQSKIKRFHQVALMLEKSVDLYLGDDYGNSQEVEDTWDDATIKMAFSGGYDIYGRIVLSQNSPAPVIVKGIVPRVTTSDS